MKNQKINLVRRRWGYIENILRICWGYIEYPPGYVEDMLRILWIFFEDMLRICWGYVEDMLRIRWGYVLKNIIYLILDNRKYYVSYLRNSKKIQLFQIPGQNYLPMLDADCDDNDDVMFSFFRILFQSNFNGKQIQK